MPPVAFVPRRAAICPSSENARMPIAVRRSGPADRDAILALMQVARGDELSEAERAQRGFVQAR